MTVVPATEIATSVASLSLDVRGMAFAPDGTLYAVRNGGDTLFTVNPSSGATTLVGSMNFPGVQGLAFAADGTLYAWDVGSGSGIGAGLLRRLGEFEFRLRGKTTGATSTFHQEAPQARRDVLMNLTDHGRFSPWLSRTLSVRIATNDDNGQITGIWPPESP